MIGFEIDGLDKIPDKGAALIVYYHGTLPIDFYYLAARCLLEKKRHIRAVGDNFLFHIPGQCQFPQNLLSYKSIKVVYICNFVFSKSYVDRVKEVFGGLQSHPWYDTKLC